MEKEYSTEELRYSNTHNYYRAERESINGNNVVLVNFLKSGYVCWGGLIHRIGRQPKNTNPINITIHIYKAVLNSRNVIQPRYGKHGCLFEKDKLEEVIESFKIYHPFEFSLTEKDNMFILNMIISGNKNQILWILNLIRHTYEFPFNGFLQDALMLKERFLPEEHIVNLLQLIATCGGSDVYYYYDQSLGSRNGGFRTLEYIKDQLKTVQYIEYIYGGGMYPVDRTLQLPSEKINTYKYWFDTNNISSHIELYLKAYEDINKRMAKKLATK